MIQAETLASWVALGASIIGGAIWVGSQSNEIANLKAASAQITPAAQDIAVIKSQISDIQSDLSEVKSTQKEILAEVRKK